MTDKDISNFKRAYTWKEKTPNRPYYRLITEAPLNTPYVPNWHGMPTAKEKLTVYLFEQLLDLAIAPLEETTVIAIFENKLSEDFASMWLKGFCAKKNVSLHVIQSYSFRFHTLHMGEKIPKETLSTLLQDPLLCVKNTWAALTL
jgi:hypothetical protein